MSDSFRLRRALQVVNGHYHWRNIVLVVCGCIASAIIQNNAPVPYVWIWSLWFLIFLALFLSGARPCKRVVWFNVASLFLALAVTEAYLTPHWQQSRTRRERTRTLSTDHEVLGYAAKKNASVKAQNYFDEKLVFDVTYTTDEDGFRTWVRGEEDDDRSEVVVFGGSYTFGAGVNDRETWPALAELKAGGRSRVHNFAYLGYGPHQMLAALAAGLVEKRLDDEPRYGIYLGIGDHIRRAAGMRSWDGHGPRFVLNADGAVARQGFFDDDWLRRAQVKLGDSEVLRRFITPTVAADEVALFVGIMDKAAQTFEQRFPGSEFHVIVWDAHTSRFMTDAIVALRKRGLRVHLISTIIPDLVDNPDSYRIHVHDSHPNRRAYDMIGSYVARRIIR